MHRICQFNEFLQGETGEAELHGDFFYCRMFFISQMAQNSKSLLSESQRSQCLIVKGNPLSKMKKENMRNEY